MDISGEQHIPASRGVVWQALNDPAVLEASIPGCEGLEKLSDTEFDARIVSRIGSIKARFQGKVSLSDIRPEEGYVIHGRGQGGAAGAVKGSARVQLADDGAGTLLRYTARAEVAGKLAGVGSRVIQGVASKTANDFFENFTRCVSAEEGGGVQESAAVAGWRRRPFAALIVTAVLVGAAIAAALLI